MIFLRGLRLTFAPLALILASLFRIKSRRLHFPLVSEKGRGRKCWNEAKGVWAASAVRGRTSLVKSLVYFLVPLRTPFFSFRISVRPIPPWLMVFSLREEKSTKQFPANVRNRWRNGCETGAKRVRNGSETGAKRVRNGCETGRGVRNGCETGAKRVGGGRNGCETGPKRVRNGSETGLKWVDSLERPVLDLCPDMCAEVFRTCARTCFPLRVSLPRPPFLG